MSDGNVLVGWTVTEGTGVAIAGTTVACACVGVAVAAFVFVGAVAVTLRVGVMVMTVTIPPALVTAGAEAVSVAGKLDVSLTMLEPFTPGISSEAGMVFTAAVGEAFSRAGDT
jgi:hypothetical protein